MATGFPSPRRPTLATSQDDFVDPSRNAASRSSRLTREASGNLGILGVPGGSISVGLCGPDRGLRRWQQLLEDSGDEVVLTHDVGE